MFLFTVVFFYDYFLVSPKPYILTTEEEKVKTDLQEEVQLLQSIPDAIYKPVTNSYKDHSIRWVHVDFNSELEFQDVCSYYDKQFKDNGWNSTREKGENRIEYRKGKYWVSLNKDSDTPHHYYVTFYWGKYRM